MSLKISVLCFRIAPRNSMEDQKEWHTSWYEGRYHTHAKRYENRDPIQDPSSIRVHPPCRCSCCWTQWFPSRQGFLCKWRGHKDCVPPTYYHYRAELSESGCTDAVPSCSPCPRSTSRRLAHKRTNGSETTYNCLLESIFFLLRELLAFVADALLLLVWNAYILHVHGLLNVEKKTKWMNRKKRKMERWKWWGPFFMDEILKKSRLWSFFSWE